MATRKQIVPDFIFESGWEVCNKIGGIYTVLSTRAKTLRDLFDDRLIFIGPDVWENSNNPEKIKNPDFTEQRTLLKEWRIQAEKEGLKVRIGRWNIPGKPIAVLVDFYPFYKIKDEIYYRMWEKFGVNSMTAFGDYDNSCMFSYATGKVIESIYRYLNLEDKKVIAHFNEWMLGMGVLYLKDKLPSIATVFTTHATSIGRSICANNKPLYAQFEQYDGDQMAKELNMVAKHSIEKQAAINASCFTTVSRLTARECLQLLGKAPDVVTPNGFEFDFVPEAKLFDIKRTKARKKLIQVASCLCGEKIENDALLLATGGRYEYKNKGIDVFIEAMNRIRMENSERQIIAFILVPAWIDGPRTDLQNRLQERTNQNSPLENPYYTHTLKQPEQDKVREYLRYLNFLNQSGNKTKIIFVPSYLNGNDGIFDLSYYNLLIGFDLTVFPSYYEPWGYTPLESIAFGIPTITTDLAGFGLWVKEEKPSETNLSDGVIVITRTDDNYFEVAEKIKNNIIAYSKFDAEQIRQAEFSAKELSQKASWSHFIKYYLETYDIALKSKMI